MGRPTARRELADGSARPHRDHRLAGARDPGSEVRHPAVAAPGDDRQPHGKPRRGRCAPRQASDDRGGGDQCGESFGRDPCDAQRLWVPCVRGAVEQPRRRGKADVRRPGARQRVEDPVLDAHEPAGSSHDIRRSVRPPAQPDRVIGRADGAARPRVEGGDVNLRPDGLLHAGGPVVRPGHRVRQWPTLGIDRETAVHRPAERDPRRRDGRGSDDSPERPGDGLPDDQDVLLGPAGPRNLQGIRLAGRRDDAALGVEEDRLAAGRPEIEADHDRTSRR